jgi:hypothetical protein
MYIKFLTFIFIGFTLLTNAQKFSNSPFSSYGIGEFVGLDNAIFSGMGNTSVSNLDSTILNVNNPSSYASLAHGQPLFSTGISSRFSEFKSGDVISNSKYIGIEQFALAIPFAKKLGLAFGLKPFSRTGYDFYDLQTMNSQQEIKYIYRGSGGTHHVFVGFAANLFEFKGHKLGIGTNLGYIFGTTLNERISYINADYISTDPIPGGVENKTYTLKSFNADFGLNYQWQINKNKALIIAATYTPAQKLTASRSQFLAYSEDVNNFNRYVYQDTTAVEKGNINMPSMIGLGATYVMRPSNAKKVKKVYQLTLNAEFKTADWSNYNTNFNGVTTSGNFSNTTAFAFGGQFTPHNDYKDKTVGYLYRLRYRAGVQYATLPIVTQNIQQTNTAFTAGIGLPFATQRSSSSLNFGFVFGKQGNGESSSVNERYMGINFGVTISPGVNDRWFRKFKID